MCSLQLCSSLLMKFTLHKWKRWLCNITIYMTQLIFINITAQLSLGLFQELDFPKHICGPSITQAFRKLAFIMLTMVPCWVTTGLARITRLEFICKPFSCAIPESVTIPCKDDIKHYSGESSVQGIFQVSLYIVPISLQQQISGLLFKLPTCCKFRYT